MFGCRDAENSSGVERQPGWLRLEPLCEEWGGDLGEVAHLQHFRSFFKHFVATYWDLAVPGICRCPVCAKLNLEVQKHPLWLGQLGKTSLKSFWLWT